VEATAERATLIAVDTEVEELDDGLLDQLLGALRLDRDDLDPVMRPALVHGGNLHPLVPVRDGVLERLDRVCTPWVSDIHELLFLSVAEIFFLTIGRRDPFLNGDAQRPDTRGCVTSGSP